MKFIGQSEEGKETDCFFVAFLFLVICGTCVRIFLFSHTGIYLVWQSWEISCVATQESVIFMTSLE